MADESGPAIEARGLTKRYGNRAAVDGVDFRIERGEFFGFLGPNGAGKSTTMRMIYRATPVDDGVLRVLGHEAIPQNDRAIKSRLGVVPQEYNLDERMTAREILEVFSRFYGLRGEARRTRISELLDFAELEDRKTSPVAELSGGLKRRVQIARGLLGVPDVLVLDEPTTGLDPRARRALWDKLIALGDRGTTIVLTTHYMDEAEKLCDRLVVMDEGKIVAEGTPAGLIADNVPPQVLEIVVPEAAERRRLHEHFGPVALARVELADRLLFYGTDGEALLRRLFELRDGTDARVRAANLEDVFLSLTGHGLS
ncbi:MAG: ABC transporter ATP-binding protein [Planctomycetes bacterium]|nr:ABC transporter ATP-binding protein [Planctomycetota bacterium]MCB9920269.1 ABC transporter ATP-binding protein [Planctomycetota bacterium]